MLKEDFKSAVGPSPREVEQFINDALFPSYEAIAAFAKKYPHHLDMRDDGLDSKPTALMLVSAAGHTKAARQLLSLGADKNATDAYGRTARDYADINDRSAVVRLYDKLDWDDKVKKYPILQFMN